MTNATVETIRPVGTRKQQTPFPIDLATLLIEKK
jgi:hypothetical protein